MNNPVIDPLTRSTQLGIQKFRSFGDLRGLGWSIPTRPSMQRSPLHRWMKRVSGFRSAAARLGFRRSQPAHPSVFFSEGSALRLPSLHLRFAPPAVNFSEGFVLGLPLASAAPN